jgi:hypothetical protein
MAKAIILTIIIIVNIAKELPTSFGRNLRRELDALATTMRELSDTSNAISHLTYPQPIRSHANAAPVALSEYGTEGGNSQLDG